MKKLTLLLALSLLIIQGTNNLNAASAATNGQSSNSASSGQAISSYISGLGYTVLSSPTQVAGNKWIVNVSIGGSNYQVYVYTSGCSILGHEDIPI